MGIRSIHNTAKLQKASSNSSAGKTKPSGTTSSEEGLSTGGKPTTPKSSSNSARSGVNTNNSATGNSGAPKSAINKFATKTDEGVFWSGLGRGGDKTAANWGAKNGGATLETTMAKRGIKLPAWDASNPASIAAWEKASVNFASGAKGHIRVLQGDTLRVKAIWGKEFKALQTNPNVKSILSVNPKTGQEVLLWAR